MRSSVLFVLAATAAVAQFQPNLPSSSLLVNSQDGAVSAAPISVPTNSTMTIEFGGQPGAPFALFISPTGQRQPADAVYFGDGWDLPQSNVPGVLAATLLVDGFAGAPFFALTSLGKRDVHYFIPNHGAAFSATSVPVGFTAAFQGVVADATSPFGVSLTGSAATVAVQGATRTVTNLTDTGNTAVSLAAAGFSVPFYGSTYSLLHLNADGHFTFGTAVQDFSSSPAQHFNGPPRVAGFWADIDSTAAVEKPTYEVSPPSGGAPGFFRAQFTGTPDWSGTGFNHWFAMSIDTTGVVRLEHPFLNRASIFEVLVGVGKGNQTPAAAVAASAVMKDLSSLDGTGQIFGSHEAVWEWFGQTTMPSYSLGINNPYDLVGRTLTFVPAGPAANPTVQYAVY